MPELGDAVEYGIGQVLAEQLLIVRRNRRVANDDDLQRLHEVGEGLDSHQVGRNVRVLHHRQGDERSMSGRQRCGGKDPVRGRVESPADLCDAESFDEPMSKPERTQALLSIDQGFQTLDTVFPGMSFLPPDGEILDAHTAHELGVVEIAAVDNYRGFQRGLDGVKVGAAEFLPLGRDDERVGIVQGRHRGISVGETRLVTEDPSGLSHGDRVVGGDGCAGCEQVGDHDAGRGLAHVVGVRFEGESPKREVLSFEIAEAVRELLGEDVLL